MALALALGCALWNWVFQGCGSLLVSQGSWKRHWAVRQGYFKRLHQAPGRVAGSSQPALKDTTPRNGFLGSTLAADPVLAALACHGPSPWAGRRAQQTLLFFDLLKSSAALPEGLSTGEAEAGPTPEMVELCFAIK